ncbi:MAG: CarD family transcriptional regulator [Hominenteromicrobium sp.]
MFQVNDTILYGSQSVCTVTEICEKKIGGQKLRYYALKPVFDDHSTIYVPCENSGLVGKMRRILSAPEIYALIDELQEENAPWIVDETERKAAYSEIIRSGDRKALAGLIRTLYLHKEQQRASGKKFHAVDEQLLDRAQKLLHEEFAYVLNIRPEDVPPFIAKRIEITEKQ